jgi:hypothetical protein
MFLRRDILAWSFDTHIQKIYIYKERENENDEYHVMSVELEFFW